MRAMSSLLAVVGCIIVPTVGQSFGADAMPWVVVSKDQKGFVLEPGGEAFRPWGFNYDHDDSGRLLEDYWESEWTAVETHFTQMAGEL